MGRWGDGEMGRWGDGESDQQLVLQDRNGAFSVGVKTSHLVAPPLSIGDFS
ncbi:hypothetical protein [Moorena bouillonii]|nr:hypothetical protein [Moorena bouillonii]